MNKLPSRCAIGIDIGGTHTKLAVVGLGGRVVWTDRLTTITHSDPAPFLDSLRNTIRPLMRHKPVGIGLSLPGIFNENCTEIAYNPNTPALVGISFKDVLIEFGLNIRLEQDLNAPALAEYHFGIGRGSRRFLAAAMGTGLGTGMIIDGKVLRFTGNTAGDSGHVILNPDGPACTAGCRGCAEAMISTLGVERLALQLLLDWKKPTQLSKLEAPSAGVVIEACHQGDLLGLEIMRQIGRWAGQWLASLTPIYMPERIALCGGIAEAGQPLLDSTEKRFRELVGKGYSHCTLNLGTQRSLAGVIGAASPFLVE